MSRFGFCGPSYTSQSPNLAADRSMNWYTENMESADAKSAMALYPTPGLVVFAALGTAAVLALETFLGRVFAVSSSALWEINSDGTSVSRGTVDTSGGYCSIAAGGASGAEQMLICVSGKAYVFALATNTLTNVTASLAKSNPQTAGFSDGYFIVHFGGTDFFQISALEDATTWSGVDINEISVFPGNIIGMLVDHRELWLWGERQSQVYYNSGAANNPFTPIPGAFIEHGLAAMASPVKLDNSVFWVGRDERGRGMAFRAQGYMPQRVSNHAVEFAWSKYSRIDDALAYSYQDQGHGFWVINFPSGGDGSGATWVYDSATGHWHERGFWNTQTGSTMSGAPIAALTCSDNFDRSNGSLGSDWIAVGTDSPAGTVSIISQQASATNLSGASVATVTSPSSPITSCVAINMPFAGHTSLDSTGWWYGMDNTTPFLVDPYGPYIFAETGYKDVSPTNAPRFQLSRINTDTNTRDENILLPADPTYYQQLYQMTTDANYVYGVVKNDFTGLSWVIKWDKNLNQVVQSATFNLGAGSGNGTPGALKLMPASGHLALVGGQMIHASDTCNLYILNPSDLSVVAHSAIGNLNSLFSLSGWTSSVLGISVSLQMFVDNGDNLWFMGPDATVAWQASVSGSTITITEHDHFIPDTQGIASVNEPMLNGAWFGWMYDPVSHSAVYGFGNFSGTPGVNRYQYRKVSLTTLTVTGSWSDPSLQAGYQTFGALRQSFGDQQRALGDGSGQIMLSDLTIGAPLGTPLTIHVMNASLAQTDVSSIFNPAGGGTYSGGGYKNPTMSIAGACSSYTVPDLFWDNKNQCWWGLENPISNPAGNDDTLSTAWVRFSAGGAPGPTEPTKVFIANHCVLSQDQWVEATYIGGRGPSLFLRGSTSQVAAGLANAVYPDCWQVTFGGTDNYWFFQNSRGEYAIGSTTTGAPAIPGGHLNSGDVIFFSAQGSTFTIKINGITLWSGAAPYISGSGGLSPIWPTTDITKAPFEYAGMNPAYFYPDVPAGTPLVTSVVDGFGCGILTTGGLRTTVTTIASVGAVNTYSAHRSRCHVFAFEKHLVGDWATGNVYDQNINNLDDAGNLIRRIRRAPHISSEQEWIFHHQMQVDLEPGLASLQQGIYGASGYGFGGYGAIPYGAGTEATTVYRAPQVTLRWSDDATKTWSTEHTTSAGLLGEYRQRVIWRRLGRSRDRVYELTAMDPCPWRIADAYLMATPGFGPQERMSKQMSKMA